MEKRSRGWFRKPRSWSASIPPLPAFAPLNQPGTPATFPGLYPANPRRPDTICAKSGIAQFSYRSAAKPDSGTRGRPVNSLRNSGLGVEVPAKRSESTSRTTGPRRPPQLRCCRHCASARQGIESLSGSSYARRKKMGSLDSSRCFD